MPDQRNQGAAGIDMQAQGAKASSLDLARRRFTADGPDRLWVADFERDEVLRPAGRPVVG